MTDENVALRNELIRKDAIIEGLLTTLKATAMSTQVDAVHHVTPLTDLVLVAKEACDAVTPMLQAFYEKVRNYKRYRRHYPVASEVSRGMERQVSLENVTNTTRHFAPRFASLASPRASRTLRILGPSALRALRTITARISNSSTPIPIQIAANKDGGSAKLKADATYFTIADGIVQHMFINTLLAGGKFAQIVGEEDESEINIISKPYTVDDLEVPEEFNGIIENTLSKLKVRSREKKQSNDLNFSARSEATS
ncbi:hypothetical protein TL16_g06102 [Triparma laevis f. inornata]|uniref:Uncharacterized protein n=1 Tax=Triparma laevis f. inornata TaxID=1714386 RepID=A0A9W7ALC4_9STRA|nr:hypothetical protein TL16_g06102 [Triparma laevis f. inornata]